MVDGVANTELSTKRFLLRPVRDDDGSLLHELWSSAGVRRFLWDDRDIPVGRTQEAIALSRQLFAERGFGLWCAWLLDGSSRLGGFGGLWPFREPPELELLYGVAEPLWGHGYATEIAEAVARYCFDALDMQVLQASTDAGNVASIRVLEKMKFEFKQSRTVDGLETAFYQLSRNQFVGRSRPGQGSATDTSRA